MNSFEIIILALAAILFIAALFYYYAAKNAVSIYVDCKLDADRINAIEGYMPTLMYMADEWAVLKDGKVIAHDPSLRKAVDDSLIHFLIT